MAAKPDGPHCLLAAGCELAEGPVWDARTQRLCFVDIEAPALFRFDPETEALERWALPAKIGCFALDAMGGAVLALANGFARFDFATGEVAPIANPLAGRADHRLNDGGADPAGRFWAGSMHVSARQPSGAVFCLERDATVRKVYDGFRVPNGFVWNADGTRLYFNDSPRAMFVAAFDAASGHAGPPFVFADAGAAPGFPDGMAMDEEGCLWSCRWDGHGIARFTPAGKLDRFVSFPVSRVTSCAFGGPRLDRLYVTTARKNLDAAALARETLAGAIFVLEPGVRGLPARRWSGAAAR